MNNKVTCPNCGEEIEITKALRGEIEKEVSGETEARVRKELEEKMSLEMTDLKKALEEKEEKVKEFRESELQLREEKRKLQDREKELTLEVDRKVDEGMKKAEDLAYKKADEEHRLKDLEKDKQLSDLKKALEEAQRKAQQGSQQTQGEVLELDLEDTLKNTFPQDLIEPIGKGVRGADIRQTVKSQSGIICGVILWESKRTKAWTDEWTSKLKEDLRAEGANIPVIVSEVLPKEAQSGMGVKDGVWVVKPSLIIPLAFWVRKNLLDVTRERVVVSGDRTRKADLVYGYITGHEFKQQLESLIEVFQEMQSQVSRERVAFEKIWKEREAQVKKLFFSTASVCGTMQGFVGQSVLQVKGLELLGLDEGK